MVYTGIKPGVFMERINRFIAHVEVDGRRQSCHVRNTGRLRELLLPGASVLVQPADNPNRKTAYSLVSVYKGEKLVNIDSLAPNKLFAEHAPSIWPDMTGIRPESSWGSSRFDFLIHTGSKSTFVEVKGVTLEREAVAMFPDAPTLRGVRHVEELMACMDEGYGAAIAFVIQMDGMLCFHPNDETHPQFGAALRRAAEKGVRLMAFECDVWPGQLQISKPIPIQL